MKPLRDLITLVHAKKGEVRILDVGGRRAYWNALGRDFLMEKRVAVTILNLPSDLQGEDDDIFKHVVGDACAVTDYPDDAFDIVHSNSVIEHVGNWSRIEKFARETRRLAPNLFVQTPYFWFPVEPHFLKVVHHWLPRPLRVSMFMRFQMGQRKKAASLEEAVRKVESEPYLLDLRMFRKLYPDCEIIRERFLLFTKSMVAFRTEHPLN